MKKRYDVPLGRTVWVVEVETPFEDLVINTPPPLPPMTGRGIMAAQALQASCINAAAYALQQSIAVDVYKLYWSKASMGTTCKEFTSKKRAQVALAKAALQEKKARMFERRDNDFNGWKK